MKLLATRGENILSLGPYSLQFEDSGLVLVEGWNYDDQRANGAGKSSLFNATCLAIYEELPRDISISDVVKRGTKKAFCEVDVQVGNDVYTAHYSRPKGRWFKKNGQDCKMTQLEWEAVIGLTYDQFLVSMYASQTEGRKFLSLNDTEKKDFLLQLMNLNEFAACRKHALQAASAIDEELTSLNVKVEKAKSKIDAYAELQVDEAQVQDEIDAHIAEIAVLKSRIAEYQKIQKPDVKIYSDIEENIRNKFSSINIARHDRNKLFRKYQETEASIVPFKTTKPDAECPHCNGGLRIVGKTVARTDDQTAMRRQHDQMNMQLKASLVDMKRELDELDVQIAEEKNIKNLEAKLKAKKEQKLSEYTAAQSHIQECMSSIQRREDKVTELSEKLAIAKGLSEKVDVLKKFINETDKVVAAKRADLEILKTTAVLYSPTGAPAYVLDSIVESFNEAVTDHIGLIWPRASYTLNSHKENKNGDVVAKFSETLVINGHETSIGSLSGGEQKAFSLAIDFAIIDILGKQFGMSLNPIVMDEPFEGLDATGREVVVELLEKLAVNRQIFVIDHASEAKTMFSRVIRVEKKSGTSSILV